jgi:hypothetical protein
MTREQQIRELQARYLAAVSGKKRLTASMLYARLSSLVTRQIKAEMRQERKTA